MDIYHSRAVDMYEQLSWGKSLVELPIITIKEVELHRKACGKDSKGDPIIRILDRGRKFKDAADLKYCVLN